MDHFELATSGEVPTNCDLGPLQRVVSTLNESSPDWLRKGVINLKLVDDTEMKALNTEYSGNNYATDVLSFSYIEGETASLAPGSEPQELGDMAIDYEIAAKQATEAGTTLGDELATLGLHGILHIHGFDHQTDKDKKVMDQMQSNILGSSQVVYRDFGWLS